jgi:hypothetical protein
VVASAADTKHLNHTFILHSNSIIQFMHLKTIVMFKVDYTKPIPNVKLRILHGVYGCKLATE